MSKGKKILFFVLILIVVLGVGYLAYYKWNAEKNKDVYEKMQEEVKEQIDETPAVEEEETVEIPIDFAKLKETNEDIYAWIEIPNTKVNYPILQHPTDYDYYLTHTVEHEEAVAGAIYTEFFNAKDFSDFNTVIYGHNMKDDSMFGDLHKFEDAEFFEQNDTITIYTETEIKKYQIFIAVLYDNRHLLYHYDNQKPEDRMALVQSLYDTNTWKKQVREGVHIDENSHIITLSTCDASHDYRYIVGAVEIENE